MKSNKLISYNDTRGQKGAVHFPTAPTSYYAYTTKIMSEISKILELEEEHQKYAELYEKTKAAVSETNVQYHYFFGSTKLQTKYIKEINSKL